MPPVTVLYGPSYDGKNEEIFQRCFEKIRRHEGHTCAYFVRTEGRVRQLREQTMKELSGCFHFPVSTFPDFIKKLYQKKHQKKRLLGNLEQKLLLENILTLREKEAGEHFYLRRFHEHPGIIVKFQEFINNVREIGIASPQELETRLRRSPGYQRTLYHELIHVFAIYCQRLTAMNAIDDTGIFLEFAHQAASGQLNIRSFVPFPELLVLEGYHELAKPEQQIFTALCEQFEQTFITLDIPMNPYSLSATSELPKPFHIVQNFIRYIQQSGFSVREFSHSGTTEGEEHVEVSIHPYRDRKEEVTEIARQIRILHRTGKIDRLAEIGVAFPVIEGYAHLIREIFPLFGIPFTMFQGYSLASSPVVVTIFRMLQIVVENYDRETIAHFFSSPLVHFDINKEQTQNDAGIEPLTLNSETFPYLDSLARQLGIIGGKDEWKQKLTEYQELITEKYPEENHSVTQSLLAPVFKFLEFLACFELEQPASPETLISALIQGIQRFHLPQNIFQTREQNIRENDVTALRTFLSILNTLQQEFSSQSSSYRLTLRNFVDMLRVAVQGEVYDPSKTLEDSVFVMRPLDARQVQFRYLFFGGLVEKDFPGQDEPNIFLSDLEAETIGLPTYQKKFQEIAYLFYLTQHNPTDRLSLSYPLQENDKDLLKSVYIDRIETSLTEKDQKQEPSSDNEQIHPLRDIYTYTEFYQWLGQHISSEQNFENLSEFSKEMLQYIIHTKNSGIANNFLNGLRAQALRMQETLCPFDGILASHWAKELLDDRYRRHTYSVSEFNLYARCPIKFLFQRVLRLEPLPMLVPLLDTPDIGTLLHKIVYRFYTNAEPGQEGKIDAAFLRRKSESVQWMQEARDRITGIAREELSAYDFSGSFWESFTHSLLAGLPSKEPSEVSSSEHQGLLATFVESEASDTDTPLPAYLEARFGMPAPTEPSSNMERPEGFGYTLSTHPYLLHGRDLEGRIQRIKLRGKIDRIDLEPQTAGGQTERYKAVIYDYKTGFVPSVQRIKEGYSFQLPLYILAVQEFLGKTCEVIAGGYYQLKSAQDIGKKGHLGSKEHSEQKYFKGSSRSLFKTYEEFLTLLQDYTNYAIQVSVNIREGQFHPTTRGPQEAGCSYCEYRQICRVDHQRMSHLKSKLSYIPESS